MSITTSPQAEFAEGTKKIAADYRAKFGTEPGAYAVWQYDAVMVLAAAIEAAKSTDAEALNKALHEIKYEGLTGNITFDAKGDRGAIPYIEVAIRDGHFVKTGDFDGKAWQRR